MKEGFVNTMSNKPGRGKRSLTSNIRKSKKQKNSNNIDNTTSLVWYEVFKKNIHVIRIFSAGIFARSPSALSGILKTPRARCGPSGRALGVFKIPSGLRGDLGEDPLEKTRIT